MARIQNTVGREKPAERWLRAMLSDAMLFFQRSRRLPAEPLLAADAWIVAPHPDDEVLGCGGTILRKRRLGAEVRVVFLTDGTGSHPSAISADELGRRRRSEARNACQSLGISSDKVFFLGLTDGALIDHVGECSEKLAEIFASWNAEQYFTPHLNEPPADHQASYHATLSALGKIDRKASVFTYPIWCWDAWPFVRLGGEGTVVRRFGRRIRQLCFSLTWLSQCRVWINVSEFAKEKSTALKEHQSQMFGVPEFPDAPTLTTLRDGDFLKRLTGPLEVFKLFYFSGADDPKLRR